MKPGVCFSMILFHDDAGKWAAFTTDSRIDMREAAEDMTAAAIKELEAERRQTGLFKQVMDLGGLKPSKAFENEAIPVFLRRKGGLNLDEAAAHLGMDAAELAQAIEDEGEHIERMRDAVRATAAQGPFWNGVDSFFNSGKRDLMKLAGYKEVPIFISRDKNGLYTRCDDETPF